MEDPYTILGVSPAADEEAVTQAYRRLAKKYHPDVNPGNPAAEERMRAINAAYEQIRTGQETSGGPADSAGAGQPHSDSAGGNARRQQARAVRLSEVRHCLRTAQYQQALRILAETEGRDALWYYLSALANAGAGNRVSALSHAREAVRLQPENPEYQSLLQRFEQGIYRYRRTGQDYGFAMKRVGLVLLSVFLAQICCFTCCRPCGG